MALPRQAAAIVAHHQISLDVRPPAIVDEGQPESIIMTRPRAIPPQAIPSEALRPAEVRARLLHDLAELSRLPARQGLARSLPDDFDVLAPLFDSRDFTVDDAGDVRSDTIWRMHALARNLDLWAGTGLELDDMAPFPPSPESVWWPRPRGGRGARRDGHSPIVRVGMGHHPGLPGFEDRWLYVAADWASPSAVRRLVGAIGSVAATSRRRQALDRAMAVTSAARAEGLPGGEPCWVLSRVDARQPDQQAATVFECTAFERGAGDALDHLTWDDLLAELGAFDLADTTVQPQVSLIWRWPADDVIGGNVQQMSELLAPALVLARIALEETLRPFGKPHPAMKAVRRGVNLLSEMEDYPPGWVTDPGDPVEVIERDLVRAAVGARIAALTPTRADNLLAHAVEWRRLPGVGLAGVVELFDAL